jgi:hypothetical protein
MHTPDGEKRCCADAASSFVPLVMQVVPGGFAAWNAVLTSSST